LYYGILEDVDIREIRDFADGNVINPNITMIEKEFGITDAHIGGMMGLFTVVGAIISIIWGYLADKTKEKHFSFFLLLLVKFHVF